MGGVHAYLKMSLLVYLQSLIKLGMAANVSE